MLENYPPLLEIQYAFMLRNLRYGWTLPERRRYFQWFLDAAKHPGGHSFAGFLTNIRKVALENCSSAERAAVADLTGQQVEPQSQQEITPPVGPGRDWTVSDALAATQGGLSERNYDSGRNLFYAAQCGACHRFDGSGGAIGPDLTSVSSRLSHKDLLENIIHPSRVISDQYGSHLVSTADGREWLGRVVPGGKDDPAGSIRLHTQDINQQPVLILQEDIEEMTPSAVSQMPLGLLNTLSQSELLDLIAYLLSRGNPADAMFASENQEDDQGTDKQSDTEPSSKDDQSAVKAHAVPPRRLRRFDFEYGGTLGPFPAGAQVRVWMPVPRNSSAQKIKILSIELPEGYSMHKEPRYGNQILYFDTTIPHSAKSAARELTFRVRYGVVRHELGATHTRAVKNSSATAERELFLQANRLVPLDGAPAALSEAWPLSGDAMRRGQVIYDGVLEHMHYDKLPGYGRGDARWACQSGYGNCTDFHSLFIAIARRIGVPAKFEIGFPLPENSRSGHVSGYHCWASFYADGKGWVPVDISEADKHPEMRAYFFGNLTPDRVGFSVGRDLDLVPPQNGGPLNYFIFPYVEVDGVRCAADQIKTHFSFADISAK